MKNPGIYILTNRINGKKYIGMDSKLPHRANSHLSLNAKRCKAIHAAIKKHGRNNFEVEIIPYPGISHEALYAIEQSKIKQFNTRSPNGYNLTDGGKGSIGFKHSEKTKQYISKLNIGNKKHFGKKHSIETRKKMSKAKQNPEAKKKMSESMTGKNNHRFGKKASNATKAKMSKSRTGIKNWKHRRRLKAEWMWIRSIAIYWFYIHDHTMKQRSKFFSKKIPNTSQAEQINLF